MLLDLHEFLPTQWVGSGVLANATLVPYTSRSGNSVVGIRLIDAKGNEAFVPFAALLRWEDPAKQGQLYEGDVIDVALDDDGRTASVIVRQP